LKGKNMSFKDRKGYFSLSMDLFEHNHNLENLLPIFAQVVVVDVEKRFISKEIIYYGYSSFFDEIPEYSKIPAYDMLFTNTEVGVQVNFVRRIER